VEIEAFATANLVAKIEQGQMDAAPIWTNLKTFDGRPFRDKVHGIIGGYPCQPFSNAGKRAGTDDPRHLWPYIEEHIRTIRPLWCFFENVGGHLSLGFEEVAQSLRDLGYKVEAGLFTAAEVGSPHKRERLFILAYTEGIRALRGPSSIQCEDGRQGRSLLRESVSTSEGELANSDGLGRIYSELSEQSTERGVDAQRDTTSSGGDELANAGSCRSGAGRKRTRRETGTDLSGGGQKSEELGDTEHNGLPTEQELRGNETPSDQRRAKESIEAGESKRADRPVNVPSVSGSTGGSEQLANSNAAGMERCENSGSTESSGQNGHQQPIRQDCWPARPGQPQYNWEEPRTVKSGMGRTVDGFASRVDELRLLGNGVVPATAELAFRTLWSKLK